jgi:hypothetical protein
MSSSWKSSLYFAVLFTIIFMNKTRLHHLHVLVCLMLNKAGCITRALWWLVSYINCTGISTFLCDEMGGIKKDVIMVYFTIQLQL